MKTNVGRLLAGVFALALLLAVGLSTQNTAQAQDAGAPNESFVCSNNQAGCTLYAPATGTDPVTPTTPTASGAPTATSTGDNLFTIAAPSGDAITVMVYNQDLPRVTQKVPVATTAGADTVDGPDANPKTIPIAAGGTVVLEAVHKSSGLVDGRCDIDGVTPDDTNGANDAVYDATECGTDTAAGTAVNYQVKAFNGNRIQVTYTSTTATFGSVKTVTVDNARPSLVSTSPTPGLIVRGNTDITFTADITDSGAGYDAKFTDGIAADLSLPGLLTGAVTDPPTANNVTQEGGVRLVVAGNVVTLVEGDFTKIDGGWRVSKTLNSTALQGIATNVPWYFETRDRANNVQRTSGSISGTAGATSAGGTVADARWIGNLSSDTFLGTDVRVSRKDGDDTVTSNAQPVTGFVGTSGSLTATNSGTDPLFKDAVPTRQDNQDPPVDITATVGFQCQFDERDTITLTADGAGPPTIVVNGAADATPADQAALADCNPKPMDSYEILGTNLITIDSVAPTLASATPVETGIGYNAGTRMDRAQRNSIKVSFTDLGKAGVTAPGSGLDPATVTAAAFGVAGHTVTSVQVVGNSVYLTLADNLGSTEKPSVTIAGSQIRDRAGNAVAATRQTAIDKLGPSLTLAKSADLSNDKVTITITTDEQLNAAPTVYVTEVTSLAGAAVTKDTTSRSPVSQTGALTYTYTHADSAGAEFSVYVEASDVGETKSTVGDNDSAADPGSFTFELDKQLNKNEKPTFSVGNVDVTAESKDVEQISPLIVTVDFAMEGSEYDRDSYRTVTLTSAKLNVRLADGTNESTTIDLDTGVTTPDNVKFTIPMVNPKLGTYTLTVQGMDEAGNTQVAGSADMKASWKVIAPRPVNIDLAPGWNLVSLPFQPANPAINSVIPADHPASTVMTFDNAEKVWLISRRDPETGNFMGDLGVMTASTAYFIQTTNFEPLRLLRTPLATDRAAPPPPPAIDVVEGWNLVPVVTNTSGVTAIAADTYFGTLASGTSAGWLKALTFDTLSRVWTSVSPGDTVTLGVGGINPCTGKAVDPAKVKTGDEPCQIGAYTEHSSRADDTAAVEDDAATPEVDETAAATGGRDGYVGQFDVDDTVTIGRPVFVGKGYWLYATNDGTLIPS